MVTAILDTNVFIRAALRPRSPSARVVDAYLDGKFQLVLSQAVLQELLTVREVEGAAVPPEVLDKRERFLTADCDRIFRLWFGERDYKKHFNLAIVQCAQGGIRSIVDYLRREG